MVSCNNGAALSNKVQGVLRCCWFYNSSLVHAVQEMCCRCRNVCENELCNSCVLSFVTVGVRILPIM